MDSIINSLKSLFSTYGFRAATIVVLSVIIVNLIKRPIVKLGIRLAQEHGTDKSVVTRYITGLPFAVAFLLTAIWSLAATSFSFAEVDWTGVVSSGMTYGALAVATYETVKKQLEAYAAKKYAPDSRGSKPAAIVSAESPATQSDPDSACDGNVSLGADSAAQTAEKPHALTAAEKALLPVADASADRTDA